MFIRYRENMQIALPEIKRIDSQQDSMYMYNKKITIALLKKKVKKLYHKASKNIPSLLFQQSKVAAK